MTDAPDYWPWMPDWLAELLLRALVVAADHAWLTAGAACVVAAAAWQWSRAPRERGTP